MEPTKLYRGRCVWKDRDGYINDTVFPNFGLATKEEAQARLDAFMKKCGGFYEVISGEVVEEVLNPNIHKEYSF